MTPATNRSQILALVGLAISSVVLDLVGALLALDRLVDHTLLLLFGGRLLLDVAIVAGLFLRRRSIWAVLTTLYALAILWRAVVLLSAMSGVGHLPPHFAGTWLLASHLAIAVGSLVLLLLRQTKEHFGFEPSV